ncbi:MAG: hypothetical protein RBS68_10115, partial [Anaerolineales bacterium]|nr:hypothetical protein [Anaerolineales bacterium]
MKKLLSTFAGLLIASLTLAACAPVTATPLASQPQLLPRIETSNAPKEQTVVIGFTTSLTGRLSQESKKQSTGLILWMNDVNNRGGLALNDKLIVKFEPRFYDDQSDSAQAVS